MLSPLTGIEVYARALGSELVIWWRRTEAPPDGSLVFLFKSIAGITDEQIVEYFTEGTIPDGVSVHKDEYSNISASDFDVINGTTYRYAAVLNDDDELDEYSTAIRTTGTPASSFKYDVLDPADMVFKYLKEHAFPQFGWKLDKDIFLDYASSPLINKYPSIVVSTGNDMQYQQYLGNMIDEVKRANEEGSLEINDVVGEMISRSITIQYAAASYKQRNEIRTLLESIAIPMGNWLIGKGILEFDMKGMGDGEVFGQDARLYTGGSNVFTVFEQRTYVPDKDRLSDVEVGTPDIYEEE